MLDISTSAATGSNASLLLTNPSVGLNISVNGVPLPQLIQLSGGQQAADLLDTLLQQALALGDLEVGVELMPVAQSASITYRVAVSKKVRRSQTTKQPNVHAAV